VSGLQASAILVSLVEGNVQRMMGMWLV
jgi:hypothetical protein